MVERLKEAIEKAREARSRQAGAVPVPVEGARAPVAEATPDLWESLPLVDLDPVRLAEQRLVAADRNNPAHAVFDVLRTRLTQICAENGWRRIAVTSPTKGCGKSLVILNLAFSMARNAELRTVLVDCDLRSPSLAGVLGVTPRREVGECLRGAVAIEGAALRLAPRLAALLGVRRSPNSAELLTSQSAIRLLDEIDQRLRPTVTLFDLTPMLGVDDTQAFLPLVDAVLLVAAGGITTPAEIEECEMMLDGKRPLIGVVLNKADVAPGEHYYAYSVEKAAQG